jgi:excisionase family DNA binding protein
MNRTSESYATAQDVAAEYNIGADTVRRKVQSGEWPGGRIGRLYRFSPANQDEYDPKRIAAALRKLRA